MHRPLNYLYTDALIKNEYVNDCFRDEDMWAAGFIAVCPAAERCRLYLASVRGWPAWFGWSLECNVQVSTCQSPGHTSEFSSRKHIDEILFWFSYGFSKIDMLPRCLQDAGCSTDSLGYDPILSDLDRYKQLCGILRKFHVDMRAFTLNWTMIGRPKQMRTRVNTVFIFHA